MASRPRLRPPKGWNYRIIVCDKDGRVEFDDQKEVKHVVPTVALLLDNLQKRELLNSYKRGRNENNSR